MVALLLLLGEFLPVRLDFRVLVFPFKPYDLANVGVRSLRVIGRHVRLVVLAVQYER